MKMLIAALLSAAIFWLILPEQAPENFNNSQPPAVKATQVDQASVKLPETERAQAKPVEAAVTGEVVQAANPVPQETPSGGKYDLMAAAGIKPEDYQAVDDIVSKESGWQTERWNTQGSGAYGLCQALPASKMASAGDDYMTNPVTQLKWCNQYAQAYGGWHGSKVFRDCTGWCFSARIAATTYKDHTWW